MKAILPKCVMFVENSMKCHYGSEIWNVIVGIILIEIINSAINIMYNFLSQNALWTSFQKFAENLRQTGLPMSIRFLESNLQMM